MSDSKTNMVTTDDLLKAIKELDPSTTKTPVTEPAKTEVRVAQLAKSVDTLKDALSPETKKALDVSSVLEDLTKGITTSVDKIIEPLNKSIQEGAERDLAFIGVLKELKKSIDENTAAVKAFGKTPASTPRTPSTTAKELLAKSIDANGKEIPTKAAKDLDPLMARRLVGQGLEKLVKSFQPRDPAAQEYINAAVKYETTGQISEYMLAKSLEAMTPKATAATH